MVIATLLQTHGVPARIERPDVLTAAHIANLDLSGAALVCLSCLDHKTPARIHYAARRIRAKAPHAKLLLGLWNAADDTALANLRDAANADHAVKDFHAAAVYILESATTDQSLPVERPRNATTPLDLNSAATNLQLVPANHADRA